MSDDEYRDDVSRRRMEETVSDFISELISLLNRHSKENGSGTPDFILAEYLFGCLAHFNSAVNRREVWYGREQDQIFGMPVRDDRKEELNQ